MLVAFLTGNLGRDAELKNVNGEPLCSFSVASTSKRKGEETTTWISCAIWGKRGASLAQYLSKGQKVAVSGELSTREGKNGKTYLEIRVAEIDLMGRSGGQGKQAEAAEPASSTGGAPDDEEIPF